MKGIEAIESRIAEEASRDVKETLDAARLEADRILESYGAEARTVRQAAERKAEAERRIQEEDLAAGLSMAEKKGLLEEKQRLLDETFLLAKEKFLKADAAAYVSALSRLAAAAADRGEWECVFSPRDARRYGKAVVDAANVLLRERKKNAAVILSSETGNFDGGVVLKNGAVEMNCTIDALLERGRRTLETEIAGMLF